MERAAKISNIMDSQIEYHYYKADFMSAYNSNGRNIELAFSQVAYLRKVEINHLKTVLRKFVHKLTNQ